MATLEDIYYSQKKYDFQAVIKVYGQFSASVLQMVEDLLKMCPSNYWSLKAYYKKFDFYVRFMLAPPEVDFSPPFTITFEHISSFAEAIVGKKAFNLSVVSKDLHLPAPDGFVITTHAFHYFLEANDLRGPINEKLADLDISDAISLSQTAVDIEQLILNAPVPENIETAIFAAVNPLEKKFPEPVGVAMRSSAVKEDGKASFAGQYKTLLNVNKSELLTGYKQIIAGKYSAQALFYRISRGILDDETPMAVLVLEMVDSASSGVMYTRDIEGQASETLLIHSVWGQGGLLVDGEVSPDLIRVSRKNPSANIQTKTADKSKQMVLGPKDSIQTIDTRPGQRKKSSLDETSARTLARWGITLENYFKQPQDIEWCKDESGNLFVLQSRPLNLPEEADRQSVTQQDASPGEITNTLIISQAETVCPGIGSGSVYRLDDISQTEKIPAGSVLVVRHAGPQLVTAIPRITAVIIAAGSRAGHFSSIAREFKVPAVTNVDKGFDDLVQGSFVTVDAGRGRVFEGRVDALIKKAPSGKDCLDDSSFRVKLQYVMNFCSKLKLTDPESDKFSPESCRSLHDIIRFVHETALKEMFSIGNRKGSRKKGAKKLVSQIPMLFYVLDVGSGTKKSHSKPVLTPENITSVPMKAILKGLSNPGICWSEASHFDWEEYDRIVMAGGIISADSAQFGSYAVLSRDYLNVNFRFGYHFVVIDTICSASKKDNYILFRFSGGGGSPEGRLLRADFIKTLLTRLGFMVKIKSDLIDAEFKHGSLTVMKRTLDMIGRLLGATKLMDMYIKEKSDVELLTDDFMNGRYDFRSAVDKIG